MSPNLMQRSFPPEISDSIIDYVQNDPSSLRACALSGRALTARSQKWLFSRVVIRGPSRPTLMPNFGGSALALHELLCASPHLASHIESLVIVDKKRDQWRSLFKVDYDHSDLCLDDWLSKDEDLPRLVSTLIAKAKNLKALIFQIRSQVDMEVPTTQALLVLMSKPGIQYMKIDGAPVRWAQYCLGPDLKHLALSWGALTAESEFNMFRYNFQPPSALTVLESLQIAYGSGEYDSIVDWLLEPRSPWIDLSRLKKLSFEPFIYGVHERGWKLLQACASSVEEFHFYPSVNVRSADHVEPIDISRLTNLKRLTVKFEHVPDCRYTFDDEDDLDMFMWLCSFLEGPDASIKKPKNLEELTVQVIYGFELRDVDIRHWYDVVDILREGTFPCLKKLHITVIPYDELNLEEKAEVVEELEKAPCFEMLKAKSGFEMLITARETSEERRIGFERSPTWREQDPKTHFINE